MITKYTYIDLFAGAGGLSEGFIRAGFEPIVHIDKDKAACLTLKTRAAYHYLKSIGRYDIYESYLKGEISRTDLYNHPLIPSEIFETIINRPIGDYHLNGELVNYNAEIDQIIEEKRQKKDIDIIIGGPPCQSYSLAGRARDENNMNGDPRNYLYIEYARFLGKFKPKVFIFENVLGLKSAGNGEYLKDMKRAFSEKGYQIKVFNEVLASNFGVLQDRKRVFIIGYRGDSINQIPNIESIKLSNPKYFVNDLLNDLPDIQAGEGENKYNQLGYKKQTNDYLIEKGIRDKNFNILTQHAARPHNEIDKEIYRLVVEKWNSLEKRFDYNELPTRIKKAKEDNRKEKNKKVGEDKIEKKSHTDCFKVVAGNLPYAHTLVAHIAHDGHFNIHPDINQNRSLTVREAARIQSFPDDYYFEGIKEDSNRTAAFKQIGNAVPPLMAYEIAKVITKLL